MDLDEDPTFFDVNENYQFVKMLSKYKVILQRPNRLFNRRRQDEARTAFIKEYNAKWSTHFTLKQILRKINNIKFRLKEKYNKNLTREKQLPYSEWERMFLNMWVCSGITLPNENKPQKKRSESASDLEDISSQEKLESLEKDISSQTKPQLKIETPDCTIPQGVVLKFEAEPYSLEDAPAFSHNSAQDFDHTTRSETESLYNGDIFGAKYEQMSIDELKRSVLISQLRTLKAQEDAARAKEKLSSYKLSKLQEKREI